jgi:hypothetical protein
VVDEVVEDDDVAVAVVVIVLGFVVAAAAGVGVEFGSGVVDIALPHFGHSV